MELEEKATFTLDDVKKAIINQNLGLVAILNYSPQTSTSIK